MPRTRSARGEARRAAIRRRNRVSRTGHRRSDQPRFIGMRRDPTCGTRGSIRGPEDSKAKALAGLHLVFNRRTLPNVFFPGTGGADWSRGVRHLISIMGGFSRWDVLSDNSLSSKLPEVFGPAPEIVSGLLSQRAEQVWRDWNPLAWRFMRRRGCFGRAAEQTSCHAGAPRPTFSWNALADILAAPALSSCAGVQIQTPSRTWTSLESEIGSALLQDQARVAIVSSARVGMGTRSREHRCGKPK